MNRNHLTNEERLILAFAEAYFRKHRMDSALTKVISPETKPEDLRVLIDSYRDRWQRRKRLTRVR
jgi:hypothetical protein